MNTIEVTEEQYAAHLAGESITIEPKVNPWFSKFIKYPCTVSVASKTGSTLGEKDKRLQAYATLLDYVEEFGRGWVADITDSYQNKWFVYFDIDYKKYSCDIDEDCLDICKVYMSEACAKGLADKLNSGEVRL